MVAYRASWHINMHFACAALTAQPQVSKVAVKSHPHVETINLDHLASKPTGKQSARQPCDRFMKFASVFWGQAIIGGSIYNKQLSASHLKYMHAGKHACVSMYMYAISRTLHVC